MFKLFLLSLLIVQSIGLSLNHVCAQSTFIQVTSPNGGEVYLPNQQYTVTWNSSGVDQIAIDLIDSDGKFTTIALPMSAATGSYSWKTTPTWYGTSHRFKVKVYQYPLQSVSDLSDNFFTINFPVNPSITPTKTPTPYPTRYISPTPVQQITVTSPIENEVLSQNVNYQINWSSNNVPTINSIYLIGYDSQNNYLGARLIASNIINSNYYAWNVSSVGSWTSGKVSKFRIDVNSNWTSGHSGYFSLLPAKCLSSDLNLDGIVDFLDVEILKTNLMSSNPTNKRADINFDGIIDISDYSLLVSQFAQQTGDCL